VQNNVHNFKSTLPPTGYQVIINSWPENKEI